MYATYSPEDDKLRIYTGRVDDEDYARFKKLGFGRAPKQGCFFAVWSPAREDLALELAGEIEDEDTSLVERAEERSERFETYSEHRQRDGDAASARVHQISDGIPFGQPILVGHHSEKRHRRDLDRIDAGMSKAVKNWDTARYWEGRAQRAIDHALYKEKPAVRARRIKGLEADLRKSRRNLEEAAMWLHLWTECGNEPDTNLQAQVAVRLANTCSLYLPRKEGDREDFSQQPTAYDALTNSYPNLYAPRTLQEVVDAALDTYPRAIARHQRWIDHLEQRLAYERAMLAGDGGIVADQKALEKGGAVKCWAAPDYGWAFIVRASAQSVTIQRNFNPGGQLFPERIPLDKISASMTKAEVEAARAAGKLHLTADGEGFLLRAEGAA